MDIELKTRPTRPTTPGRAGKVEAIEQAARELFQKKGFGAVSMDEIAKAAGVSKATIYAHFSDKEELFASMMEDGCSMSWVKAELAERPVEDVRAVLNEVAWSYVEVIATHAPMARIVIAEAERFPRLASYFYDHGPCRANIALAAYLDRAVAAGKVAAPDTARAADQFFSLLRCDAFLRVLLCLHQPDQAAFAGVVDSAIETFMRAYKA